MNRTIWLLLIGAVIGVAGVLGAQRFGIDLRIPVSAKAQYAAVDQFCKAFLINAHDRLRYESEIAEPMAKALDAVGGNKAAVAAIKSLYEAGLYSRDFFDSSGLESKGCLNIRDKLPDPR